MSTDCSKIYNLSAWTHSESIQFSKSFLVFKTRSLRTSPYEFNRIKKCMKINPENEKEISYDEDDEKDGKTMCSASLVLLTNLSSLQLFISSVKIESVRSNKSFHFSLNQKLTSWQVTDHGTSSGVLVLVTFSSVSSFHYSDTRFCLESLQSCTNGRNESLSIESPMIEVGKGERMIEKREGERMIKKRRRNVETYFMFDGRFQVWEWWNTQPRYGKGHH